MAWSSLANLTSLWVLILGNYATILIYPGLLLAPIFGAVHRNRCILWKYTYSAPIYENTEKLKRYLHWKKIDAAIFKLNILEKVYLLSTYFSIFCSDFHKNRCKFRLDVVSVIDSQLAVNCTVLLWSGVGHTKVKG